MAAMAALDDRHRRRADVAQELDQMQQPAATE
jgi:hypothetical protein